MSPTNPQPQPEPLMFDPAALDAELNGAILMGVVFGAAIGALALGSYLQRAAEKRARARKNVPPVIRALSATQAMTRPPRRYIQWPRTTADQHAEAQSEAYWQAMSQAQRNRNENNQ